jgi:hypothetical protein
MPIINQDSVCYNQTQEMWFGFENYWMMSSKKILKLGRCEAQQRLDRGKPKIYHQPMQNFSLSQQIGKLR